LLLGRIFVATLAVVVFQCLMGSSILLAKGLGPGTAGMTGRLRLVSPEQKVAEIDCWREGYSRRGDASHVQGVPALRCPSDVGAMRHDTSLDAHAIRHTGLLFFYGAPAGSGNLGLK